jgi:anti-anti-sigma regulatory factor
MQQSIVVKMPGRLDISLTNLLAQALKPRLNGLATYFLDLSCTEEILDSGLALLLMAQRCARRMGATLYVVTARLDLIDRCRHLGIDTEPTCEPVGRHQFQEVIELPDLLARAQ